MKDAVTVDHDRYMHELNEADKKEQWALTQSDWLADDWLDELNKSGIIGVIHKDISDISMICQREHKTELEVLRELAFEFVLNRYESLPWN